MFSFESVYKYFSLDQDQYQGKMELSPPDIANLYESN